MRRVGAVQGGFFDAIKLNKLDVASIGFVELTDKLFALGARARNEKMDHGLRQQELRPARQKPGQDLRTE